MIPRVMLTLLALTAIASALSPRAEAIGCLSGGAAGALAGHMVHHGVLGAVGGCIAGHEYKKHHDVQNTRQDDRYRQ